MEKRNRNIINKTTGNIMIFSFGIILFLSISAFLFIRAKANFITTQLFYTETSNLDYLVFLRENDFYNEKFLKKDKHYIANLIDYIEADYKYTFNSSVPFNYTYKYSIVAKVIVNEKGDMNKVLYNMEEIIVPEQKISLDDSANFIIKGTFRIDYQKYNDLIIAFKRMYTLSIDSRLIISLIITIDGKYDGFNEDIRINQNLNMTLPLSEQTIGIDVDYRELSDSNIIEERTNKNDTNNILYILSFLSLIISFIFIYFIIKLVRKLLLSKSKYIREYDKIMKEYNQIIVKTKDIPQLKNLETIEIVTFKELLDVRESIQKPILHIEIIPKELSWFIILNKEEVYRYILESKDK